MREHSIRGGDRPSGTEMPRRLNAIPAEQRPLWLRALADRHIEEPEEVLERLVANGIPPAYVEGENPLTPDDYLNAISDVNEFLDSMEARKK